MFQYTTVETFELLLPHIGAQVIEEQACAACWKPNASCFPLPTFFSQTRPSDFPLFGEGLEQLLDLRGLPKTVARGPELGNDLVSFGDEHGFAALDQSHVL